MTYCQAIRYLEGFVNYEKSPHYSYEDAFKLDGFVNFLKFLGNPQDKLKVIHIAGSKGKGSTCAFCAYILRAAGFSAGLYTSPHLVDFRERIRILEPQAKKSERNEFEGLIKKREISLLVKYLKGALEKYRKISSEREPTFFEICTVLAFLYFKKKRVDFVVLETGMGGRLDATNAASSLVCGITPISYEHTQYLGDTIKRIAFEKAGVIKEKGTIVVSASQVKDAREVIRKRCAIFGAKLYEVTAPGRNYKLKLIGRHQQENAAVAVKIAEAIKSRGFKVSPSAIKNGLAQASWPGRCEVVSKVPLIVLDGAQNKASAAVIRSAIRENFKFNKLILVLGISSDKDIKGICSQLESLADRIILTRADTPRAARLELIKKYLAKSRGGEIRITNSVKEARDLSLRLAGKKDLILVTGSLFVVGEFRDVQK